MPLTTVQTLENLADMFSVADIMVRTADLKTASSESAAKQFLAANSDYDVVPVTIGSSITAYLERGATRQVQIGIQDIISDGTSILDGVDVLAQRKFCFVLGTTSVVGYLHFSDLNDHLVKMPFFVLFQALEQLVVNDISTLLTRKKVKDALPQRFGQLAKKLSDLKRKRADRGWANVMYFEDILRFACHFDKISLTPQQAGMLSQVRNSVSHADRAFVSSHQDVRRLSEAKRICVALLSAQ